MGHIDALAHTEIGYRPGELPIRDGVRRACRNGGKAARQLVNALGAAFEACDLPLDAEFDRLVITRLEVKAGNAFGRSPIATPQRCSIEDIECGAKRRFAALAEHHQQMIRHELTNALEERQIEVRRRVMFPVGILVTMEEKAPIGGRYFAAHLAREAHTRARDFAPLLLHLLAMLMVEGR